MIGQRTLFFFSCSTGGFRENLYCVQADSCIKTSGARDGAELLRPGMLTLFLGGSKAPVLLPTPRINCRQFGIAEDTGPIFLASKFTSKFHFWMLD